MKKLILISLMCLFSAVAVLSQTNNQLIKVKRLYYLNDRRLSNKELKTILKGDPKSAVVYKMSMTNTTIGTVFAGVGAAVMLYGGLNLIPKKEGPLPDSKSDEEMIKHLVQAFIGSGIMLAGVPFILFGNDQLTKSVTIYNYRHAATGFRNELKVNIGLSKNGVEVSFKF